jgi:hypothetical protein
MRLRIRPIALWIIVLLLLCVLLYLIWLLVDTIQEERKNTAIISTSHPLPLDWSDLKAVVATRDVNCLASPLPLLHPALCGIWGVGQDEQAVGLGDEERAPVDVHGSEDITGRVTLRGLVWTGPAISVSVERLTFGKIAR